MAYNKLNVHFYPIGKITCDKVICLKIFESNYIIYDLNHNNLNNLSIYSYENNDNYFLNIIKLCMYAFSFFFDDTYTFSYKTKLENSISPLYNANKTYKIEIKGNSFIYEKESHWVVLNTNQIENFINNLHKDSDLCSSVIHYNNAIEEPTTILFELYKSFEILKPKNVISKTKGKKFTQLANDKSIIWSRHTGAKIKSKYGLGQSNLEFCYDLIKNGIYNYNNKITNINDNSKKIT